MSTASCATDKNRELARELREIRRALSRLANTIELLAQLAKEREKRA